MSGRYYTCNMCSFETDDYHAIGGHVSSTRHSYTKYGPDSPARSPARYSPARVQPSRPIYEDSDDDDGEDDVCEIRSKPRRVQRAVRPQVQQLAYPFGYPQMQPQGYNILGLGMDAGFSLFGGFQNQRSSQEAEIREAEARRAVEVAERKRREEEVMRQAAEAEKRKLEEEAAKAAQRAELERKQREEEARLAQQRADAEKKRMEEEARTAALRAEAEKRRLEQEARAAEEKHIIEVERLRAEAAYAERRRKEEEEQRKRQAAEEAERKHREAELARQAADAERRKFEEEARAAAMRAEAEKNKIEEESKLAQLRIEAEKKRMVEDAMTATLHAQAERKRLEQEAQAAAEHHRLEVERLKEEAELARRKLKEAEEAENRRKVDAEAVERMTKETAELKLNEQVVLQEQAKAQTQAQNALSALFNSLMDGDDLKIVTCKGALAAEMSPLHSDPKASEDLKTFQSCHEQHASKDKFIDSAQTMKPHIKKNLPQQYVPRALKSIDDLVEAIKADKSQKDIDFLCSEVFLCCSPESRVKIEAVVSAAKRRNKAELVESAKALQLEIQTSLPPRAVSRPTKKEPVDEKAAEQMKAVHEVADNLKQIVQCTPKASQLIDLKGLFGLLSNLEDSARDGNEKDMNAQRLQFVTCVSCITSDVETMIKGCQNQEIATSMKRSVEALNNLTTSLKIISKSSENKTAATVKGRAAHENIVSIVSLLCRELATCMQTVENAKKTGVMSK